MNQLQHFFFILFLLSVGTLRSAEINISWKLEDHCSPKQMELIYWNVLDRTEESMAIQVSSNSNFQFMVDSPGIYKLKASKTDELWVVIQFNQDTVSIIKDDQELAIFGSLATEELYAYEEFRLSSFERLVKEIRQKIRIASKNKDHSLLDSLSLLEHENYQKHLHELMKFSMKEMAPTLAQYYVSLRWIGDEYLPQLRNLMQQLRLNYASLEIIDQMNAKLERLARTAIGVAAPELKINESTVTNYSINQLTLIEFWGSWCGPCRRSNPHLVKVYESYQSIEFEIIGFAIERSQQRMENAANADGLLWKTYTDEKMYQSPVVQLFNVSSVPTNFLVNSSGKIVAKNLHWKDLEVFLRDHFKH